MNARNIHLNSTSLRLQPSSTQPVSVVITTEDRVGTLARVTLVGLVSILVGATFVIVLRMTALAEPLHTPSLLVGASLMSLGVQVFLAPWLTRSLGRRGTWTISQTGIAWQPRLGRRRFIAWTNVHAVRFLPMTIQIRGTHTGHTTRITLGSGLLTGREWQSLRSTIAEALLPRFPDLAAELDRRDSTSPWTDDPRVVHLGALGFLTAITVFAMILSLHDGSLWPGWIAMGIAGTQVVRWIVGRATTSWHAPTEQHHDTPRLAA